MALYPIVCDACGAEDLEYRHMSQVTRETDWGLCSCGAPWRRKYTPPNDHTDNRFKAYWSRQLSEREDGKPEYIKNAEEWRRRMKAIGSEPYVPGVAEEAEKSRHAANQKKAAEARKQALEKAIAIGRPGVEKRSRLPELIQMAGGKDATHQPESVIDAA